MDAAEDDDVGVGLGRFARQAERVADEIGDVLHFGALVVVREDDGVAVAGEALDLGRQGNVGHGAKNTGPGVGLRWNGLMAIRVAAGL